MEAGEGGGTSFLNSVFHISRFRLNEAPHRIQLVWMFGSLTSLRLAQLQIKQQIWRKQKNQKISCLSKREETFLTCMKAEILLDLSFDLHRTFYFCNNLMDLGFTFSYPGTQKRYFRMCFLQANWETRFSFNWAPHTWKRHLLSKKKGSSLFF